jgi:DNA-binding transcriptional LysR family regulator
MAKVIDWDDHIGRRLRLRDLRVFFAVMELGSLAKAGLQLGVSQPAVSQVIADLEHSLKVRLFDRNTRGVEPTIYAKALLTRARAAFDELRQGVKDIEFLSDPGAGEVRIGSPDFLMVGLIATIVDRMGRESPRIIFHAMQGIGPTLSVLLRERKIDAVIDRGSARQTAPDDFVSETLFDEQFFIVAGPQSRWARRRKIDLAELVDEPWIMPTPFTAIGAIVAERFRARGVTPPKSNVVSDSMALRGALLATGRYLSVLPESTLQFATERLQVKALPVDMPAITRTTEITTFRNRSLSPVLKRFIDCTREVAKSISNKSRRP